MKLLTAKKIRRIIRKKTRQGKRERGTKKAVKDQKNHEKFKCLQSEQFFPLLNTTNFLLI